MIEQEQLRSVKRQLQEVMLQNQRNEQRVADLERELHDKNVA